MIGTAWFYEVKISWIGKKELFNFWLLRKLFIATGGIPVDRSTRNNAVGQLASRIKSSEELHLCIPPEGSRHKQSGWRSGFYYIALEAGVQITCSFIDYATKTTGIGPNISPSGDIDKDMTEVTAFYKKIYGKYPNKQSPAKLEQR